MAASNDPKTWIMQMLREIEEMQGSGYDAREITALLGSLKDKLSILHAHLPESCIPDRGAYARIKAPFEDCLFLQDCDFRYTWFSSDQFFGMKAPSVIGKTEGEFFSPSEAERLKSIKEQVMKTGKRAQTEVCFAVQGKQRCFDCIYYPWRDEAGRILGLRGYVRDATSQKDAMVEILKMTRAVQTAPTAIVLTDLEGRIEYANPSLLKNSGFYDLAEMIGK
jgi:PAS domain S-box-containing protein